MKDTVILEHKIYISVKRAVSISSYSSDYIGQLCREGKLDSKMVGNSWFLTEESLLNYSISIKNESVLEEKPRSSESASIPLKSDSIIIDRKNFISAKRAAEVSGYTSDYIGQLCRGGKLESKRIGKVWFVSEKSILNHCISTAQEENTIPTPAAVSTPSPIVLPTSSINIPAPTITKMIVSENVLDLSNKKVNISSNVVLDSTSLFNFTKLSLFTATLIITFVFLFSLALNSKNFSQTTSSANVISSSVSFIESIFSFFISIPKLAFNSIFNTSNNNSNEIINEIEKPPPEFNGLAVTPSSNSSVGDEIIKKRIRDSFSDEVEVKADKSGTAGIITPVFKKVKGENFIYVMVPVDKNP